MIQQVFFAIPDVKVASFTSDKIRQPWPEQWACDVSLIPRHWRNKHLTTDEANVNLSCTLTIWHDYVFKKGTRAHKHGSDPETLKETHRKPSNILLVLSQVPPNGACHLTATWVHSSVHGTTHWPVTPPWPFAWRTAGSAGTIPSATSSTWAKVTVEKGWDVVIFDPHSTHITMFYMFNFRYVGLKLWGAWWRLRVEELFFRRWRRRPRAPTAETAPR